MFEPRCKVCNSPRRREYEEMKRRGSSYRDMALRAKVEFGESISYVAFQNHFMKHAQMPAPKETKMASTWSFPSKDSVLVLTDEEIGARLTTYSQIIDDCLHRLLQRTETSSCKNIRLIFRLIARGIKLLEKIRQINAKLPPKSESKEEILQKIWTAFKRIDLPPEKWKQVEAELMALESSDTSERTFGSPT
jgi:hypothetical protein